MTDANANPEPTTTPPAAPAAPPDGGGDLAALQAQIDAAAKAAADRARADHAKAQGFDSPDALDKFLADQKAAAEAAKTEEQKRADELAAKESAAAARQAEADKLIRTGIANLALVRAGVAPENLADAARLLDLPDGELTDEAADAAVAALKAKPIAASVFAASAGAKPPSGTTGQPPSERNGGASKTAYDRGAEEYRRLHPVKSA